MAHFLDECFQKVDWAEGLYKRFKNRSSEYFLEPDLTEIGSREEGDALIHFLRFVRPMPSDLTFLAGDILHNLRGALDHAVCALGRYRDYGEWAKLAFPFPKSAEAVDSETKAKCKKLPDADQQFIKSLRVHGGDSGEQLLYMLHKLDLCNKHRHILRIGMSCDVPEFEFDMLGYDLQLTHELIASGKRALTVEHSYRLIAAPALDPSTGEFAFCVTSKGHPPVKSVHSKSWMEFDYPGWSLNAQATMEAMIAEVRRVLIRLRDHAD